MPLWDVIVAGVGAMGAAACWRLARRGARVLGLEQFHLGHDLGSSGGDTRMIRMAYFEHADYVPLVRRSYALWDELGEATSRRVLFRTGALYAGPADGELVAGSLAAAAKHDLPHERLDAAELARRYPFLRLSESFHAIFELEGGFVLAEDSVRGMAGEATRLGAVLRVGERVRAWTADSSGVRVTTDRETHVARQLVLTVGAWTAGLSPDLGFPLEVTRQILGWVRPADVEPFRGASCWAVDHGEGILYGFPARAGEELVKVANHQRGPRTDPDRLDRNVATADAEGFLVHLRRFVPRATGPVERMKVCMYTYSPDGHFVVDRHPRHENVIVACGFSGHGFKFAPVVGEALADLARDDRTDLPIGFLSHRRFG